MYLSLDEQRIDDVSAVVDGDELRQLRLAGFLVEFDDAHMRAEREREVGGLEVACDIELSDGEFNFVRSGFQVVRRDLLQLFFKVLDREVDCCASYRSAAASERSDTGGDSSCIAMDGNHIVRVDSEFIRHNLCKCGFLA